MEHTFKLFLTERRKRMQHDLHLTSADFERISKMLSTRHVHLNVKSLRKMWDVMLGKRKLSKATLDRLALFAGFQDWQDLDHAIHGEVDASINYKEEQLERKNKQQDVAGEQAKVLKL